MDYITLCMEVIECSQKELEQGFEKIARYAFIFHASLKCRQCLSHRHVDKT